jgi:hypothetical protein
MGEGRPKGDNKSAEHSHHKQQNIMSFQGRLLKPRLLYKHCPFEKGGDYMRGWPETRGKGSDSKK